jgi:hypothetical protein
MKSNDYKAHYKENSPEDTVVSIAAQIDRKLAV